MGCEGRGPRCAPFPTCFSFGMIAWAWLMTYFLSGTEADDTERHRQCARYSSPGPAANNGRCLLVHECALVCAAHALTGASAAGDGVVIAIAVRQCRHLQVARYLTYLPRAPSPMDRFQGFSIHQVDHKRLRLMIKARVHQQRSLYRALRLFGDPGFPEAC